MEPIAKIGLAATKARHQLHTNLCPSIGGIEPILKIGKIGPAAIKNNQHGILVSKPALAIRSISQHGTLGCEPARLRLYINLYPSIGRVEPVATRDPAGFKNIQHSTLVSKPAMAIRSISQYGTLGCEPARLRLYTNLYPSTGGMEPIAKIGSAATNNQHG